MKNRCVWPILILACALFWYAVICGFNRFVLG